jgi:hypothetical protein
MTAQPNRMSQPAQFLLPKEAAAEAAWLELVRRHVGSLRYGAVQIIVHDGHVTQIEKTERVRFDNHTQTVSAAGQPAAGATPLHARSSV